MVERLAVFIPSARKIDAVVQRAQLAESLGYESGWVIQVADREATIVAAAIATATSKIGVGTGVLPTYPRTPAVMAQTAATLDELSGGRFILGLGPSHKVTIEMWHGMELSKPVRSVKEYVGAIRAIFAGEPFNGDIYRTAFSFMGYKPERANIPIYLSCLSPRMCRLAGEIADGAVLWMCAPEYIRSTVVPNISKGRAKAGKTMEGFEIVAAVPLSMTEDRSAGMESFRKMTTVYWNLPFYRKAVEGAGLGDALALFDAGGSSTIPPEAIETFAGIGDTDACASTIQSYRDAGVTLPALSTLPSHEGSFDWDKTMEELKPG